MIEGIAISNSLTDLLQGCDCMTMINSHCISSHNLTEIYVMVSLFFFKNLFIDIYCFKSY